MHRRTALFAVSLMWVLGAVVGPVTAAPGSSSDRPFSEHRTAEVLVKYRRGAQPAEVRSIVAGTVTKRFRGMSLEVLDPAGSVADAVAALNADPRVEYAEPNYLYRATSIVTPDDPHYPRLWGLDKIRMPEAWTLTRGSKDVTVAVVDSGLALSHPDLAPNVSGNPGEMGDGRENNAVDDDGNGYVDDWRGWDWIDDDNQPNDSHGHGSHVAGTIGARGNDSFGIAGVNWDVNLLPLRTLDPTGLGTSGDIAAAFTYAGELGVDVVNASFGGSGHSTALLQAINAYPETLFVVAAGNDGNNNDLQPQYPCNFAAANLLCVAASDSSDNLAGFSNYGATAVDLAAPGVGIVSSAPATTQPFTENFETDISGRWTTGGVNNLWTRGIDAHGGFLSDSLGINYLNDTDSWIATVSPFSLREQEDCRLHLTARLDLENGKDLLLAEASRNADVWTKVASWTGNTDGRWVALSGDVGAFDGAEAAYLRFRLSTNSTGTGQGAEVDDVRVRCLTQHYSGQEFVSASGTSMAAPHVAGVAALLKAADPDATVSEIVGAIMSTTETTVGLAGRVASSGRLDAAAALEWLTGTPLSEPEPAPLPTAPLPGSTPHPSGTASPEPEPTPEPPQLVSEEHARSITLRVRQRFATGRIALWEQDGHAGCRSGVVVQIKRNGRTVRTLRTAADGSYLTRIPDRSGRYRAVAPTFDVPEAVPTQTCLIARSRLISR